MTCAPRLLIIEDDPGLRELFVDIVSLLEYEATIALDVEQALSALRVSRFDLIVTDAFGPPYCTDRDRWCVLDDIAAQAGATPVVLCTAHAARDYADFRNHGFAALLLKPFDLHEFIQIVTATFTPSKVEL